MNKTIEQLTGHLSRNELLNESRFAEWLAKINLNLAADYLEFMKTRNGGEGAVSVDTKKGIIDHYKKCWCTAPIVRTWDNGPINKLPANFGMLEFDKPSI